MIKKLLPIVLIIVGTGAGVGAGIALRPSPETTESTKDAPIEKTKDTEKKPKDEMDEIEEAEEEGPPASEYVKMNNQFVVPIVRDSQVSALVVMSISIEVEVGKKEVVYQHEPKLRDSFLQVLFNHANLGGFDGEFTNLENMTSLRQALWEVAFRDLGDLAKDVLILEMARQDY